MLSCSIVMCSDKQLLEVRKSPSDHLDDSYPLILRKKSKTSENRFTLLENIIIAEYAADKPANAHCKNIVAGWSPSQIATRIRSINKGFLPLQNDMREVVVDNIFKLYPRQQDALDFWNSFVQAKKINSSSDKKVRDLLVHKYARFDKEMHNFFTEWFDSAA